MLRCINSTHSLILFTLSICLHSINCLCFCDLLVMASGHTIERAAAASLKHTEELWVVRSRAELEIFFLPSHALPDLQESICLWLWMVCEVGAMRQVWLQVPGALEEHGRFSVIWNLYIQSSVFLKDVMQLHVWSGWGNYYHVVNKPLPVGSCWW